MKKNKFLTSAIILVIGGFVTKILGFIIRVIYTRIVKDAGVSLYALVMPTYSLIITLAQLALPTAISKLVAENKESSKKILISSTFLIMFVNIFLVTLTIGASDFIASTLLQKPECRILIIAMALTIPFISISSVIKGYFFGKQKMFPNTFSNVIEQLIRISLLIIFLPRIMEYSVNLAVTFLILSNIITEFASIIILLLFLPKHQTLCRNDIKPDKKVISSILSVSLPTLSSRLLGNIGLFFEPIILTNILLKYGYTSEFITHEYGVYNAYTISLLILPSFFVTAVCSALIPEISKYYSQGKKDLVRHRAIQAIIFSFILGLSFSIIIFIFREPLLNLVYATTQGADYIKLLAPFFVLFYIEAPLISILQALDKSSLTMKVTFVGIIIKLSAIALFSTFKIGIYGLIYAEIINILFVVLANGISVYKTLKNITPDLKK